MENEVNIDTNIEKTDLFASFVGIIAARKRLFLVGFLSVLAVTLLMVMSLPDSYEASTTMYIKLPTMPNVQVPYLSEFDQERNFIANQTELIKSRSILEMVVKKLNLTESSGELSFKAKLMKMLFKADPDPMTKAVGDLKEEVDVRLFRSGNIIEITAVSKKAKDAALLANTVAQTYIEYSQATMLSKVQKGYSYLLDRVQDAAEDLEKAETALKTFKEKGLAFYVAGDVNALTDILFSNQLRLDEINKQVKKIIESKGTTTLPENFSPGSTDGKTDTDFEGGIDIKIDRFFTDDTGKNLEDLLSEKDSLETQNKELEARLKNLNNEQITEYSLSRVIANAERAYNIALENLEDARILEASEAQQTSIIVTEKAYPPSYPSLKTKAIFLLLGFVLSFVFACTVCFISEYMDNSVRSIKEAEYLFRIRVFAAIPKAEKNIFQRVH